MLKLVNSLLLSFFFTAIVIVGIVTTPEYVKDSIKEAIEEHAASRNHPYATQVEPGFVTLNN
ncbi:hypothetical protein; putative exported protein [Xenorhabdus bovienii str. Jollieti]|uniref:Uncharacterized protein n=1 Tax=Xenorhabdus bovienii (strain SS-2004) TaxID=406818 RepID=D3V7S3_XENBS|nr:hypothetical protein [Xenorhabdus bovienii]CBJ81885.1 hypothetical protein; putative exported protein [Xenorhabdus bovienii SS-2004]CDH27730.1 hypothetical protein; putative exported protein [Xenorhabdus bovienii str. Jollieti]